MECMCAILTIVLAMVFGGYLTIASEKQKEAKQKENARRKNCHVHFNNGISENEFRDIAYKSISDIKKRKISLSFDNAVVYGRVLSQTGLSSWSFSIDFNDYGYITGKYWITNENDDSIIPRTIANNMKKMIEESLRNKTILF